MAAHAGRNDGNVEASLSAAAGLSAPSSSEVEEKRVRQSALTLCLIGAPGRTWTHDLLVRGANLGF